MSWVRRLISPPSRIDRGIIYPTQNRPGALLLHLHPIFLFQPPSGKSAPVAKEISLLDLEDCELGW